MLSHLYRNGPATPGRIAAVERQRPQLSETERQVLVIAAGIMDRLTEAEVTVLPDLEPHAEPESHSAPDSPSVPESPSELPQDASAQEDDSGLH